MPTEGPREVARGESFEDIRLKLLTDFLGAIERFGLAKDKNGNPNPKMALSLVGIVGGAVEQSMREQTFAYVTTRLNEQIEKYIALGFHTVAGYTPEAFRDALAPVVAKTLEFFRPMSERPLRDGEFSVLLVLPTEWVPRRRLLATLLGQNLTDDITKISPPEIRACGKASPNEPYVLLGINGGRGLKDFTIEKADEQVTKKGNTYLSLTQLIQLLLVRPNFLSAESDLSQSKVFVMGERWGGDLVCLVATREGITMELSPEKNIHGGVGVGKPYYSRIITS